jgi:hypothetical protein
MKPLILPWNHSVLDPPSQPPHDEAAHTSMEPQPLGLPSQPPHDEAATFHGTTASWATLLMIKPLFPSYSSWHY